MSVDGNTLAIFALGLIFSVIGWLITDKVKGLQETNRVLFTKLDAANKSIADFRIEIAKEHYPKPELDFRFSQIDLSIRNGFHEMANKFDDLAKALTNHMLEDTKQ